MPEIGVNIYIPIRGSAVEHLPFAGTRASPAQLREQITPLHEGTEDLLGLSAAAVDSPVFESLTTAQEWIEYRPGPATVACRAYVQVVAMTQPVPKTGRRVLLVDDVQDVLDITGKALNKAGFEVVQALTPADALAILAEQGPFDCLITDQSMPSMNGNELVRVARALCPGLPALIITGRVYDEQLAEQSNGVQALCKPFTRQDLLEAISHLVASENVRENPLKPGTLSDPSAAQSHASLDIVTA